MPNGSPIDPTSIAFQTLVGSLYGPLSYQSRFANNLFALAHGHPTFDNSDDDLCPWRRTRCCQPAVLQPVVNVANATVKRYEMDPAGRNFMEHNFTTTGDLRIPVLTLHNTWDPGVPAFHEAELLKQGHRRWRHAVPAAALLSGLRPLRHPGRRAGPELPRHGHLGDDGHQAGPVAGPTDSPGARCCRALCAR